MLLIFFSKFVPNKIITIRDKDALWMTPEIKRIIFDKSTGDMLKTAVKNTIIVYFGISLLDAN